MAVTYATTGERFYLYSNSRLKARSFFDRHLPWTFVILPCRMVARGVKVATFAVSFGSGLRLASRFPPHLTDGKPGTILSIVANGTLRGEPAMMPAVRWRPVD